MIIKNIPAFLKTLKSKILEIDKDLNGNENKVLTSGWFLEKEGSFDKKKFAPYYTIAFDAKTSSGEINNKTFVKGNLIINKVLLIKVSGKRPDIYSLIDDYVKEFIKQLKFYLAQKRIKYSTVDVKAVSKNDPLITIEIIIKDIYLISQE